MRLKQKMVRPPSYDSNGIKRGAWSEDEDNKLRAFVKHNGHPNWRLLPSSAGLKRCGKSCRLRWVNYLKPDLKKGNFSKEEEDIIIQMHKDHGNKWSFIAEKLPGRTDNDIKNHWHAHIKKRRLIYAEIDKKPNYHKTATFDAPSNSAADQNPEIINGHDANLVAQADQVYDLPPLFSEEEFADIGLCHNDTPTFADESDGGITYDHMTCLSQLKIDLPDPLMEDNFLEYGHMSSFSDSSGGGITSRSDSTTEESDGSFWSEYAYGDGDDTIDMVLWQ